MRSETHEYRNHIIVLRVASGTSTSSSSAGHGRPPGPLSASVASADEGE